MNDREKAIIMAHTGICMLTGDKFQIFHKYVEDIMGRPIWTGDIGWLEKEIKEKSKADFIALCADESDSENPNKSETVLYSGDGYADGYMVYDMAECPNCGYEYEDGDKDWGLPFCPNCGQSLNWESEE